jgi:mRNA interferase RelE/StbE
MKLDKTTQKRMAPILLALQEDPRPHGALKLTSTDNLWRIRVGDYRLVYTMNDNQLIVLVIDIIRRTSTTYNQLP